MENADKDEQNPGIPTGWTTTVDNEPDHKPKPTTTPTSTNLMQNWNTKQTRRNWPRIGAIRRRRQWWICLRNTSRHRQSTRRPHRRKNTRTNPPINRWCKQLTLGSLAALHQVRDHKISKKEEKVDKFKDDDKIQKEMILHLENERGKNKNHIKTGGRNWRASSTNRRAGAKSRPGRLEEERNSGTQGKTRASPRKGINPPQKWQDWNKN